MEEKNEDFENFETVMRLTVINGTTSIEVGVWADSKEGCRELFDHAMKKADQLKWMKRGS